MAYIPCQKSWHGWASWLAHLHGNLRNNMTDAVISELEEICPAHVSAEFSTVQHQIFRTGCQSIQTSRASSMLELPDQISSPLLVLSNKMTAICLAGPGVPNVLQCKLNIEQPTCSLWESLIYKSFQTFPPQSLLRTGCLLKCFDAHWPN